MDIPRWYAAEIVFDVMKPNGSAAVVELVEASEAFRSAELPGMAFLI